MEALIILARVVAGATMAWSGVAKLLDRSATRSSMVGFGVPSTLAPVVAAGLPVVELAVAASMLVTTIAPVAAAAMLGLLVAFSVAIGANLRRGDRPPCSCFGAASSEPISGWSLVRNAALAVPPAVVVAAGPDGRVALFPGVAPSERGLAVACAVLGLTSASLVVAVAAMGWRQRDLGRSVRALEALVDQLELAPGGHAPVATPAEAPRLPIGVHVPAIDLLVGGSPVALAELTAGARAHLLVFASTDCGPCRQVMERLASPTERRRTDLDATVVLGGSPEDHGHLIDGFADLRFAFDPDRGAASLFGATWTPAAVVVRDGRVASRTVFGPGEIEVLVTGDVEGEPAAWIEGTTVGQEVAGLDGIVDRLDRPTALIGWRSTCPYCEAFADDLEAWVADAPATAPDVLVLTTDTAPAPLGDRIVVDPEGTLQSAAGLDGTPTAVLVDPRGTYRSELCIGEAAIRALLGMADPPIRIPVELGPTRLGA